MGPFVYSSSGESGLRFKGDWFGCGCGCGCGLDNRLDKLIKRWISCVNSGGCIVGWFTHSWCRLSTLGRFVVGMGNGKVIRSETTRWCCHMVGGVFWRYLVTDVGRVVIRGTLYFTD